MNIKEKFLSERLYLEDHYVRSKVSIINLSNIVFCFLSAFKKEIAIFERTLHYNGLSALSFHCQVEQHRDYRLQYNLLESKIFFLSVVKSISCLVSITIFCLHNLSMNYSKIQPNAGTKHYSLKKSIFNAESF